MNSILLPVSMTTAYKWPFLFFLFRSLWVRVGNTNNLQTYIHQYINLSQWWTLHPWSTSCPKNHSYQYRTIAFERRSIELFPLVRFRAIKSLTFSQRWNCPSSIVCHPCGAQSGRVRRRRGRPPGDTVPNRPVRSRWRRAGCGGPTGRPWDHFFAPWGV